VRSISFTPSVSGQSSASTVTIARDGDKRREEDNSGGKRVVYLDLPTGNFVLVPDEKIYAEMVGPGTFVRGQDDQDGFEEVYVHTAPIQSTYQNLGAETVNGTTTTKYKVTVNTETNGSVSESETLIWIDEALGMPVKSETHSEAGTRRMELSKVSLSVDKALFAIPKDYQKVEMQVLQQRIK
jgi:outer membrane lipoprotein-sorting protein